MSNYFYDTTDLTDLKDINHKAQTCLLCRPMIFSLSNYHDYKERKMFRFGDRTI